MHGHKQYVCVFCSALSTKGTAGANSSVAVVGVTPYKLSLKVPWVNKLLAGPDFTLRKRKKAAGAKYSE